MSELMNKIKDVKCSDVFDFKKVGFPVNWSDEMVLVAGRAIRNYDEMKEQIAQLQAEKAELVDVINKAIYATGDNSLISALHEAEELLNKLQ